jgi:hypothetical protein
MNNKDLILSLLRHPLIKKINESGLWSRDVVNEVIAQELEEGRNSSRTAKKTPDNSLNPNDLAVEGFGNENFKAAKTPEDVLPLITGYLERLRGLVNKSLSRDDRQGFEASIKPTLKALEDGRKPTEDDLEKFKTVYTFMHKLYGENLKERAKKQIESRMNITLSLFDKQSSVPETAQEPEEASNKEISKEEAEQLINQANAASNPQDKKASMYAIWDAIYRHYGSDKSKLPAGLLKNFVILIKAILKGGTSSEVATSLVDKIDLHDVFGASAGELGTSLEKMATKEEQIEEPRAPIDEEVKQRFVASWKKNNKSLMDAIRSVSDFKAIIVAAMYESILKSYEGKLKEGIRDWWRRKKKRASNVESFMDTLERVSREKGEFSRFIRLRDRLQKVVASSEFRKVFGKIKKETFGEENNESE